MELDMTDRITTPIGNVVWWTGPHNTGKTTMGLSVPGALPRHYEFFDFDGKTSYLNETWKRTGDGMGAFYDMLVEGKGLKPIQILQRVEQHLAEGNETFAGRTRITIFDNWTEVMETALRDRALTMLSQISSLSPAQQNDSMLTYGPTYMYYKNWLKEVTAHSDIVFILTHVKNSTIGRAKIPGKFEARGQRPLDEMATMKIWLNPSDIYGGAPTGVVFKNPALMKLTPQGNIPMHVLPPRIAPCTWAKIYDYFENPVGDRELRPEEKLSQTERDLLDGEMSDSMKLAWREASRIAAVLAQDSGTDDGGSGDPLLVRVQGIKHTNPALSPVEILNTVKLEFPNVSIPDIIRCLA